MWWVLPCALPTSGPWGREPLRGRTGLVPGHSGSWGLQEAAAAETWSQGNHSQPAALVCQHQGHARPSSPRPSLSFSSPPFRIPTHSALPSQVPVSQPSAGLKSPGLPNSAHSTTDPRLTSSEPDHLSLFLPHPKWQPSALRLPLRNVDLDADFCDPIPLPDLPKCYCHNSVLSGRLRCSP